MRVDFTLVVQSEKTQAISGMMAVLHPPGKPRRRLATGTSDEKGYVPFAFDVPDGVAELVASVFNPKTRKLLHRSEPRKTGEISKWWAVEIKGRGKDEGTTTDTEGGEEAERPGEPGKFTLPAIPDPKAAAASRIAMAASIRDGLRKAAKPEVQRRIANRQKGREIARKVLGRKPKGRIGPTAAFVPAGEETGPMIEKTRELGIERLSDKGKTQRGWVVPEDAVKEFGLKDGATVPPGKLDNLLTLTKTGQAGAGSVFEQILQECGDQHLADAVIGTEKDTEQAITDASAVAETTNLSLHERIAAILDAEIPLSGARPTAADLAANLNVTLPTGPSDVDAYYDYHSLQVAWLDAWTALIDRQTVDKVKELYDSIVDVVDPEDIPGSAADFSEIDELYDLLDTLEDSVQAAQTTFSTVTNNAPEWIMSWIPEIADSWTWLTDSEREYVRVQYDIETVLQGLSENNSADNPFIAGLMNQYLDEFGALGEYADGWVPHITLLDAVEEFEEVLPNKYRDRALAFVDLDRARDERYNDGDNYSTDAASRLGRAERLLGELKESLVEPYQFDVFAAGSYNFGSLATYRQRWRPISYQVGDLAGSIPLAPNEKRSYSVERKTSSKSTHTSSRERFFKTSDEFTQTRRAEGEITGKAKNAMSAKADVSVGATLFEVVEVDAGSEFATSQENASSRVKKELREITRKAAQEYRDENKTSVTHEATSESTFSESRELQNPNNELTVTYLFYELQRRYEVSERLHDLDPVIMVAFEMPQPHEITEAWLLKHDWILEKSLLDESFRPALVYLRQTFAGDEVSVEILEQQWKAQLAIVADLRRQGKSHQSLRDVARDAVQDAVDQVAYATGGEEYYRGGIGRSVGERVYAAEGALADGEAENARSALEWAEQDLNRIEGTAREAVTALEAATKTYVDAVQRRLNRRIQIDRLILHVKENILHYMQEIWRREHPDQRYLRLYDMEIQWPGPTGATFSAASSASTSAKLKKMKGSTMPRAIRPGSKGPSDPGGIINIVPPSFEEKRKLYQVADLRKIMGFRGNLAIFRLTEDNALSTFMAQDFLDTHFGVMDPDPLGQLPTATEALHIARCAWRNPKLDDDARKEVTEWLMEALHAAHSVSQEIIVPTGELFIEALPGSHPLLEDFKLRHRAVDAANAANQLRTSQLDLVRRAMRLDDGDVSDPDIDRQIRIEGPAQAHIDADGDGDS